MAKKKRESQRNKRKRTAKRDADARAREEWQRMLFGLMDDHLRSINNPAK